MPNFASLSCFYSKLRWGLLCPPIQNRVPEYPVQNRVKYDGHCCGSFISEGPALQTEQSDSRGGDGPQQQNCEISARAYVEARSKATW